MEFFTLKWKSKKTEVRLKWIENADPTKPEEEEILSELALEDSDKNLRQRAFEKLGRLQWKSKKAGVRLKWIENADPAKPEDKKILSELAKEDSEYNLRQKAFEKLGISDSREALIDRAKNDKSVIIRKEAIKEVTDQDALAYIFQHERDKWTKVAVLKKIEDEKILIEPALNDEDEHIRGYAAEKINDQKTLLSIIENEKDHWIRGLALTNLKDELKLADIAVYDPNYKVRKKAAQKINNPKTIEEIKKRREEYRKKVLDELQDNDTELLRFKYDDIELTDTDIGELKQMLLEEMEWKRKNDSNYRFLEREFAIRKTLIIKIGEELNERGGLELMKKVYTEINGDRGLDMNWHLIGEWLG